MRRGIFTSLAVGTALFCILLGMDREWTGAMCMMLVSAVAAGFAR